MKTKILDRKSLEHILIQMREDNRNGGTLAIRPTAASVTILRKNPNHPPKGSTIAVEPIKSLEDIAKIKALLKEKPRDYAIFVLGINTNLRASDILSLTIGQVKNISAGHEIILREQKTRKHRRISVNNTVASAIASLLTTMPHAADNDPLFQSRKGGTALTVPYLNNLVKEWCRKARLKGNYGSHTLRKTFGYIQRTVYHTDLPILTTIFNHSSQKNTLSYLCIQPEEIKATYMNEI